jgi:uncharacterized membrane protein (UPF0127 family)
MILKEHKESFLKYSTQIIFASLLLGAFIFSCVYVYTNSSLPLHTKNIHVAQTPLIVDVADTDAKRIQGLSGRKDLKEGTGMLFIFDTEGLNNFWMKDMNFDIDIIWFNKQGELMYVVEDATPASYPESLGPKENSMYVLEVPAGFFKKQNWKLGDKIDLY